MTKRTSPPVSRTRTDVEQEMPSLFERIGAEKVERLVAAFYARVDKDPVIRPLYGKTLTCAMRGLTDFTISWLGGPPTYDVPRARLLRRHLRFGLRERRRCHLGALAHLVRWHHCADERCSGAPVRGYGRPDQRAGSV